MNLETIERAKKQAKLGSLSPTNEPHLNESHPHLRAWNLTAEDIRRQGALFNVYKGASFGDLAIPMLLVLWPGYGVRSAGLHSGVTAPGQRSVIHTHPDSDECLFNWVGKGQVYCGDRWINSDAFDCLLAPCGVSHGEGGSLDPAGTSSAGCGFASPPQLDLYLRTPYFTEGTFRQPEWSTLQAPQDRSYPQ